MKIEIDVEIPEGYEVTGAYFIPEPDDTWLGLDGQAHGKDGTCNSLICYTGMTQPRIILRKKPTNLKAIILLPVGSFEEATPVWEGSSERYFCNPVGFISRQPKPAFDAGDTWLRREDRRE